ncbi:DUF4097 family beta strand repeat-containing protein [Plantactinospora sonchi]|uniref:DUF4097 family beta strand repeat-containing protein n=1 Tax=Plantactinospora sonchi TaxID=1544735 RepID=A0ABU7RSZ6_9ACTN
MAGFWRPVGHTLAAVTVLAGGVSAWSWLARQTVTERAAYQGTFTELAVELGNGSAEVTAGPPGQATVEQRLTWSYGRPVVRQQHTDGRLLVTADCGTRPRLPGCAVAYRIAVPPEVVVTVRTGSGTVSVRDVTGSLDLRSRNGDVRVENVAGELRLHARSGRVDGADLHSARVEARSGSGDVALRFATPPTTVLARADSGAITIAVPPPDGYNLHASAESGTRTVTVREDPTAPRRIDAQAGNGNVRVAYTGG